VVMDYFPFAQFDEPGRQIGCPHQAMMAGNSDRVAVRHRSGK
jgi:hypothetical protein